MSAPFDSVAGHAATVIDGVRVLWAEAPGPLRASLLFGVGQAHERLPWHGMTHLVEHLALTNRAEGPHAYNGATELTMTSFQAAGAPADVVDHLGVVCRALSDLPVDRLEHERGVMRSEAAQRGSAHAGDALMVWRWGAGGYATPAFEEYALRWVGRDQVREWSTRFGANNAVLWLSGPPPEDLTLPLRSSSTPVAQPPLTFPGLLLPGAFPFQGAGVIFSLLLPREPAMGGFLWLLHHRLQERLRHSLGLSYGPQSANEVLDASTRVVQMLVPCLPENGTAVTAAVCAVLAEMTEVSASEQEWSRMTSQMQLARQAAAPDEDLLSHVDNSARLLLQGGAPQPAEDYERQVHAVTPADALGYARQVLPSLVLGAPDVDEVPTSLAGRLPEWSPHRVSGSRHAPRNQEDTGVRQLIVGDAGVSLVRNGNLTATVRFSELAAALVYDDGAAVLIGTDAMRVSVAPEQWSKGREAVRHIGRHVPAPLQVPSGPRIVSDEDQKSSPVYAAVVALAFCWLPLMGAVVVGVILYSYRKDLRTHPRHVQAMFGVAAPAAILSTVLGFFR